MHIVRYKNELILTIYCKCCSQHKNRLFSSTWRHRFSFSSLVSFLSFVKPHEAIPYGLQCFISLVSIIQRKTALSTSRTAKKCTLSVSTRHCVATKKNLKFARKSSLLEDFGVAIFASHITTYILFVINSVTWFQLQRTITYLGVCPASQTILFY
jgi:hypothetical protein